MLWKRKPHRQKFLIFNFQLNPPQYKRLFGCHLIVNFKWLKIPSFRKVVLNYATNLRLPMSNGGLIKLELRLKKVNRLFHF